MGIAKKLGIDGLNRKPKRFVSSLIIGDCGTDMSDDVDGAMAERQ